MASNKLGDLNDMLFNQLVRLDEDDIDKDTLNKEIERSRAMTMIAGNIISNAEVVLKATKYKSDSMDANLKLPRLLDQSNE